jgi:hypothetical protein
MTETNGVSFVYDQDLPGGYVEEMKGRLLKDALYAAAKKHEEGSHFVMRVTSETRNGAGFMNSQIEYRVRVDTQPVQYMDVTIPRAPRLDIAAMRPEPFWTRLRKVARYLFGMEAE